MSELPKYIKNFTEKFTLCIKKLNGTDVATERYTYLLELQSAFEVLRTAPEGASPLDPAVVRYVSSSQELLHFLLQLEITKHCFLVQHLSELRRRNIQITSPQAPSQLHPQL